MPNNILFLKILCALGNICIRWRKKSSSHWKNRNVKSSNGQTNFLANNYTYITNVLLKSGLTVVTFLSMRKICKILVWQDNLYFFNHTTLLFVLFHSQFLLLQLVKFYIPVVNLVFIVDWKYLTTVKQCFEIFFSSKLCVIRKFSIRWSLNKHITV